MPLTGEAREYHDRICKNIDILVRGYRETVDYTVPVKYHRDATCNGNPCACPVISEKRTRTIHVPGLLQQLRDYGKHKDVNRDPKAERNPPRVKKPKLMPELNGFLTLDEITCDIYMTVDRILEECERDRTLASQSIDNVLTALPYQVSIWADSRPDQARALMKATDKWVALARRTLNLSVSQAQFAETVCGNCQGGLAIAWDNSSEVRCIGTPTDPPCGETYPMSEWISLYEKGKRSA